jgi:hypothetical protein
MGQAGKRDIRIRNYNGNRNSMGTCDGNERWGEKQTTYFIKKDKANGKKIKQVV